MDEYQQNLQEETLYLERTLDFLKKEIEVQSEALEVRKANMLAARKEMYEDTVHFTQDFDKLTELNQYLNDLDNQTASYKSTLKRIEKFKRMLHTPYFGRFDFLEESSKDSERIYIGLHNLMDAKTHYIYVYDWRAPISSIFYRSGLEKASYGSPMGTISGEVLLKRQYKIEDSKLKYFFDSNIRINDEILQEVLSHNASTKMRNIVETIQKEQDIIIRDNENDLLIVQGVAGSGKTSIALHRIAFLLYEGMNSNFGSNNILIISPNNIFSTYISNVLPELGEENVAQTTFEDVAVKHFNKRLTVETRNGQLEYLISMRKSEEGIIKRDSVDFKGSSAFVSILEKLLDYYERTVIDFEDLYYNGEIIGNKDQMKRFLLDNTIAMPLVKRLSRLESIILNKLQPLQKKRLGDIEKEVQASEEHEFEIKAYSRLLSIKEAKSFIDSIHRVTEVDYLEVYKLLFSNLELFLRFAKDEDLPRHIEQIVLKTREGLANNCIEYEDFAPLLYLKLKLEGSDMFSDIKQVVIDEAQDYYPVQFEVFKLLFKHARYTVLGDINQTIEKGVNKSHYDTFASVINKRKAVMLTLNKSYRSSSEINAFTQRLLDEKQDFISFDRHEEAPRIIQKDSQKAMDGDVAEAIKSFCKEGYDSIAVICKTWEDSKGLYDRINKLVNIKFIDENEEIGKGALIIPSYMAKGLEFDAVIVYGVDKNSYSSDFDRKLLYVACTRALHRLELYYTGEKSAFI